MKLGNICKIKYGKDHKQLSDGNVPVYGSGGIMRYVEQSLWNKPSVLIPRKGTLDNLFFVDEPFWTVDTLFWTDIDENLVLPKYLYYQLKTKELSSLNVGTAVPSLTANVLNEIEINLPPLKEQKQVVEVLGTLDDKIAADTKLNGYLLELAKARLSNLAYKENPLGMVSVGSFAATMTNGSTPSRKKPDYWEGGSIPWVKTGEVNNNLLFKTNEHITELALAETSVHLLPKNTVVMALYGSGTAGRLAILQEKATTNQACTAMVCRTPSQAFYLFLTLQGMYREIDSKTRGSVQQNLSKDIVASLMIPAVTEDLLGEIRLCDIYDQVRANEYESLQLASLRDALLPKLMSGEIDVSKIDPTQLNSHLTDH